MNEFENTGFLKKNMFWLVALAALIVFGLLFFNGYDKVVNDEIDKTSVVTGNFSCLPVKEGGETEETCTLGLRSRSGEYYALDVSRIQDANTDLKAEDTIAVTGFVLPESSVLGSKWDKYAVVGIIKVNTLLRTR
ncbi:MAG TPA: hypothetical protein VJJ48_02420 [Candidatus Paceibacterota bacterium]